MVRDVFDASAISGLKGWMGVGHGQSECISVVSELTSSAISHCW